MGRWAWIAIALVACGRVRFDPLVDGDGSVIGGDALGDAAQASGCTPMPQCPGGSLPLLAPGQSSTSGMTGNTGFSGSCGGNGNPEAVFKLNPLSAGSYTINVGFRVGVRIPDNLFAET